MRKSLSEGSALGRGKTFWFNLAAKSPVDALNFIRYRGERGPGH